MPNNEYINKVIACNEINRFTGYLDDDMIHRLQIALNRIPAADVEPKRKWIPVTDADNLPKKSTPCLVACNQWGGEKVRKATYLVSEKIFTEGAFDITEYVTHWMPRPEPPKEENNA